MRPSVNPALQIHDFGETTLHEEVGDLQAAHAVVTQASDGLVWVQLGQPCGHVTHGNGQQLETVFADAGGLNFPRLAYVEQNRCQRRDGGGSHTVAPT